VRVDVSAEAGEFVRGRGGRLWVWAARPRVCCWGPPAYVHAATVPPTGLSGFSPAHADGPEVWFRAPAGADARHPGNRGARAAPSPGRGLLGRLLVRPVIGPCDPRLSQGDGDGLDLDQLAGVAEHGHAEQGAGRVVLAEGRADDIPGRDQVGPLS